MVRFNRLRQPERAEDSPRRDASDLLNYIEYVRRCLYAVSVDTPMPPHFPAPDVRREERRIWGFKPEEGCNEPDLTEWQLSSRLIGKVRLTSRELRWYGPMDSSWIFRTSPPKRIRLACELTGATIPAARRLWFGAHKTLGGKASPVPWECR